MARARDWQSRGNRFDSDILHRKEAQNGSLFFVLIGIGVGVNVKSGVRIAKHLFFF